MMLGGSCYESAFDPSSLNLLLWLNNDNLGDAGNLLETWLDQSGSHRDVTTTSGTPPSVEANAINGQTAAFFAVNEMRGSAPMMNDGNFVVEIVTNPQSINFQVISTVVGGYTGNAGPFTLSAISGSATMSIAGTTTGSASAAYTAGVHVFGARRTSTTAAQLRIDGTATAVTLADPLGTPIWSALRIILAGVATKECRDSLFDATCVACHGDSQLYKANGMQSVS